MTEQAPIKTKVTKLPAIERFESNTGVRIYRLPVEAFPRFIAYTYLLLGESAPTLIDCGSNMDKSVEDLVAGIDAVRQDFGESVSLDELQRILITHGHIDHHGGLNFVREHSHAAVGIHPLDQRILVAYEERVVISTKNLRVYLQRAGVSERLLGSLMELYGFAKRLIKSEAVDISLAEDTEIDGLRFFHTPGHCPGQVCIQIGDVMLTADHVLSRITPHQAPESITHYTGLGHYLESLDKVRRVEGIRLALGGHEAAIYDLYGRIDAIKADHQGKLARMMDIISTAPEALTISEISKHMYPEMSGYNVLLALEEVGAHVEYLYERGQLSVANLDEIEREDNPALRYCPA